MNGDENLKLWEAHCIKGFSPLGLMATPVINGTTTKPEIENFGCLNDKYFDKDGQGVRFKAKVSAQGSNRKNIYTMEKTKDRSLTQETNHFVVFDENSGHKAKMIATEHIQYVAEKPLLEESLVEMALDFESEDMDPRELKQLDKGDVENMSHIPQCATRTHKVEHTKKDNFVFAFGGKLEAGVKFAFGKTVVKKILSIGLKAGGRKPIVKILKIKENLKILRIIEIKVTIFFKPSDSKSQR